MNSPDSFRCRFPALKNKTVPAALVLIVAISLLAFPAAAHAPGDIVLKYDETTKQLSVTITHPVSGQAGHYIRNVRVKANDRVVSDTDYKSQPSTDTFTYVYMVPLNAGDTIRVTATCSQGPSKETLLELAAPRHETAAPAPAEVPASAPAPTRQAAAGLLPFIGTAAILLLTGKK